MKLTVVLNELDKCPIADRISQLVRVRKASDFREISGRAATAMTDCRLDPSLPSD